MLRQLMEQYADQRASYIAAVFAFQDDRERAFNWLQRAIEERQRGLAMRTDPLFDRLRDDPRWPLVLEAFGVSDEQLALIEF